MSEERLQPGIYRHYKGGMYRVASVVDMLNAEGVDELTPVPTVIYEPLGDDGTIATKLPWYRSLKGFTESVEVNGQTVPRFARVDDAPEPLSTPGVRFGTTADVGRMAELVLQLMRDHCEADSEMYDFVLSRNPDPHTSFGKAIDDPSTTFIVSTDDNDGVTGFVRCDVVVRPENAMAPAYTKVEIPWIAVDQSVRSKGHGAALIAGARELATRVGANQLVLEVWNFNERARTFYERVGFKAKRTEMRAAIPAS